MRKYRIVLLGMWKVFLSRAYNSIAVENYIGKFDHVEILNSIKPKLPSKKLK